MQGQMSGYIIENDLTSHFTKLDGDSVARRVTVVTANVEKVVKHAHCSKTTQCSVDYQAHVKSIEQQAVLLASHYGWTSKVFVSHMFEKMAEGCMLC